LRALRADARTAATPVVLLHPPDVEPPAADFLRLGAEDCIPSTLAETEVMIRVRTQLRAAQVRKDAPRRAAEHLRSSERSLADLFDSVPVGLRWMDADGIILRANGAELDLLGYRADEYIGRAARDFYTDRGAFDDMLHQVRAGRNVANLELEVRCKNRSVRHVLVDCSCHGDDGWPVHLRCFTRDITDQKLREARLGDSMKEVHHRVKNNLQVISSILNLQMGLLHEQKTLELLKDIDNRIKSMALVHELMYQTRDLASIDVEEYLRSLVSHLGHTYHAHRREMLLDVDVDRVMLNPDTAIPLGLVVTELISNALKHAFPSGQRGTVRLALKRTPLQGSYSLGVSDNGVGLPADLEPARASTLGLSIVNALTQQLGGTMTVTRHHGTVFQLAFSELAAGARRQT
jgi:PAS domain S-box-containing protein